MGATHNGPTSPKCSDEEFVALVDKYGATKTANLLGCTARNVFARRRRLEDKFQIIVSAPNQIRISHPGRIPIELKNGSVLIGSDFHIWPGEESTCLRAFKK